ncbi:hypothetical protein FSP39_021697 [Pinctada imbricata]|uniref:Ninjurin-1 n=1 Tax=Pinctada imbricata TaxID=66713 RepID=A0AA88YPD1_PINIB|nr:hypothetical protein FSP39_021697 [Pinctada imbricata]
MQHINRRDPWAIGANLGRPSDTLVTDGVVILDDVRTTLPLFRLPKDLEERTIVVNNHQMASVQGEDVVDGVFEDETDGKNNTNKYSTRKNFVCSLFDVALMMANLSQLKTVLDQSGSGGSWFFLLVICIGLSIILQIAFAILMLRVWCIERKMEQKCPNHTDSQRGRRKPCCTGNVKSGCCSSELANNLDEIGLFVVFAIIMLNMVIATFGLSRQPENNHSPLQ